MNTQADQVSELKLSLTKNRAEHLGKDVWNEFVIPRFFNKNNLQSDMPTRLEGGRGSGKTMILRYLSFYSQFSRSRSRIPKSSLNRVGLYWKADTQFLRMMQKRGVCDDAWVQIFQHYLTVKISAELINSILYIAGSDMEDVCFEDIEATRINGLRDFNIGADTLIDLNGSIDSLLRKTEMLTNNVADHPQLIYLPSTFISFIIDEVRKSIPQFSETVFYVYIDEYENLLPYQQRVINTAIKGSERPLIYNIAIKLNGMSETLTLSDERLENRADYQVVNLDRELGDRDFDAYVAEIFIKKIVDSTPFFGIARNIDLRLLTDSSRIEERFNDNYLRSVKGAVENILPGRTHEDLASEVFDTPRYLKKLKDEILRALRLREVDRFTIDDFIDFKFKKASIVSSSLLYREKLPVETVAHEFRSLVSGEVSKFGAPTAWEHNNFIGSYLRIVTSYKANSTFYSGFDVYVSLSGGNVRHFLELCRTAFSLVDEKNIADGITIDNRTQHLAAKITSEELFREISRFTPHGFQLQELVSGLGALFQECQRRESQSEPEVLHFGLKGDRAELSESDLIILAEAEKWGVLKSLVSTKIKSSSSMTDFDYLLNPVYAPFFNITYRKNRKIDLEIEDFRSLYTSGKAHVPSLNRKLVLQQEGGISEDPQGSLL